MSQNKTQALKALTKACEVLDTIKPLFMDEFSASNPDLVAVLVNHASEIFGTPVVKMSKTFTPKKLVSDNNKPGSDNKEKKKNKKPAPKQEKKKKVVSKKDENPEDTQSEGEEEEKEEEKKEKKSRGRTNPTLHNLFGKIDHMWSYELFGWEIEDSDENKYHVSVKEMLNLFGFFLPASKSHPEVINEMPEAKKLRLHMLNNRAYELSPWIASFFYGGRIEHIDPPWIKKPYQLQVSENCDGKMVSDLALSFKLQTKTIKKGEKKTLIADPAMLLSRDPRKWGGNPLLSDEPGHLELLTYYRLLIQICCFYVVKRNPEQQKKERCKDCWILSTIEEEKEYLGSPYMQSVINSPGDFMYGKRKGQKFEILTDDERKNGWRYFREPISSHILRNVIVEKVIKPNLKAQDEEEKAKWDEVEEKFADDDRKHSNNVSNPSPELLKKLYNGVVDEKGPKRRSRVVSCVSPIDCISPEPDRPASNSDPNPVNGIPLEEKKNITRTRKRKSDNEPKDMEDRGLVMAVELPKKQKTGEPSSAFVPPPTPIIPPINSTEPSNSNPFCGKDYPLCQNCPCEVCKGIVAAWEEDL